MAYNGQQIKVVEGNAFAMLFPLKARTYTLNGAPIDTDIDLEHLTNIVVKIGSTSYEYTKEAGGLQIMEDGSLAKGTYDIVITGEYWGDKVRAAYYQALVVVAWNNQSDAEQYIAGSPIVCDAAYLIAGVLTDAELEQLKAELRAGIAAAEQAKADAEAAKEHYDQLAEEISGVAQEQTLTQGVQDIRADISHIDIDTTTLAKETTAEAAKQAAQDAKAAAEAITIPTDYAKQGTNANATNTAIFEAVSTIGADQATIAECYDILEGKGLVMPQHKTLENMPAVLETITKDYQGRAYLSAVNNATIINSIDYQRMDFTGVVFTGTMASLLYNHNYLVEALGITGTPTSINAMLHSCSNLEVADLVNLSGERIYDAGDFEYGSGNLRSLIGYRTLDDVLNNDISVFNGIRYGYRLFSNRYDRATLRALINGLADLTAGTAKTLTMGATNLAKLTAEDIAIATAKNWTIA